jgi:hypothetical protein
MPRRTTTSGSSTWARVEKLGLALPGVEPGTAYGSPALKLHGQLLACIPTNKAAEPDSLVVRIDFRDRDELLAAEPDVYYLKEHYVDYACVLVRLPRIAPDTLRDLLLMSWKFVNSKAKTKRKRR